VCVLEC